MNETPMPWDPALADQWVDAWLADLRRHGASDRTLLRLARNLAAAANAGAAALEDPRLRGAIQPFVAWLRDRVA